MASSGDFEPQGCNLHNLALTLGSEEHEKDALDRELAPNNEGFILGGVLFITHFHASKSMDVFGMLMKV